MNQIINNAVEVIRQEAAQVLHLTEELTPDFEGAVKALLSCKGKVVVTGMGKSGHIGRKIAATLASTGTPAFFVHPGEAYHGDLGMIEPEDVVLALANSGKTPEVTRLLPYFKKRGNVLIAITGNPSSTLAVNAKYHISVAIDREACPLNLAPTTSTTAMLVIGDALAICLMKERAFKAEDYAQFHPGGNLGRRLLTKVSDVMRAEGLPLVPEDMTLPQILIRISDARLGIAAIVEDGFLKGVITDGDIRRAMVKYGSDFFTIKASEIMSRQPKVIAPEELVVNAEEQMRRFKIHSIIVVSPDHRPVGVLEFFMC